MHSDTPHVRRMNARGGGVRLFVSAQTARHVSLNFFAPPELLAGPAGMLEGSGKGMRHLKVRSAEDIERRASGAGWQLR
jgi:hypothetical protein